MIPEERREPVKAERGRSKPVEVFECLKKYGQRLDY